MAGWYDDSEDWMTEYNESIQDSPSINTSSSNNNLATNIGSFIGGIIGGAVNSPRFKLNTPTLNFDNVKLNTPQVSSISGSTTNNYNGSNERPQLYKIQDFENSNVNQALKQNMKGRQYRKWLKSEDYAKRKNAFDLNQYNLYAQSASDQAAYDAKALADRTLAEMQANWMSAKDILKQTPERTTADWNNVQSVQNWLNTNFNSGLDADNMYGKNTNNAITAALQRTDLTEAERQGLTSLQNSWKDRMIGQKKLISNPHPNTTKDQIIPSNYFLNVSTLDDAPLDIQQMYKQGGLINKHQQGGTMVNNEQELQKAFMAFLIEDATTQGMQIQSEEDLKQYVESLGQEGIQAKYQEFMKLMSGASAQKPSKRLGGHLNYLKQIKGACPDGEETYYFKEGGSVKRGCKPCMEKAKKGVKFDNEDMDPVKKFKCGRKVKKAEPGTKFTQKTKTDKYGNTTHTRTYPGHKSVSYTVSEDGEGEGYYSDHKGRSRVEDQDSLGRVYHNGPYKFQKKRIN